MSKTKGGGAQHETVATKRPTSYVKAFDGTAVTAGSILIASVEPSSTRDQRGKGSDDTLFAKADGKVKFGFRQDANLSTSRPTESGGINRIP
ncbi:MAG: 50S ribosomal protein L27 [Acidimicrobiales bacterium]